MMPAQIVILNDFAYVDGGASQVALSSARALALRGHKVLFFTAVGPVSEELQSIPGLEVVCLGQHEVFTDPNRSRAMIQGLWNSSAASALKNVIRDYSRAETIVHLHAYPKALSSSVVRVAAEQRIRTVLTMHDYFYACPNGGFYQYPSNKICSLKPMSLACIGTQCDKRTYAHKLWRVARQAIQDHPGQMRAGIQDFIAVSDFSANILRPHLPSRARIHRVSNPIAGPQQPQAAPADYETFSYVGRLSPEKGPHLFAASAGQHQLQVRFIGEGPERPALASMLPHALFTGWMDPVAVRKLLAQSRALVFPSLWYETQGLVVAEAAALGVPAIVPSECAAREWVEDGVTGLVFRRGDVEDLGRKLLYLRDRPEAAAAMGAEAYRRYWERPETIDLHCQQLEAVYASMLTDRSEALQ